MNPSTDGTTPDGDVERHVLGFKVGHLICAADFRGATSSLRAPTGTSNNRNNMSATKSLSSLHPSLSSCKLANPTS
ncbi:hypothetical protein DAPPUDRAFT_246440 [Daphnia pulex]|uniref:Uncharacterized protein n=1 Tax=Daphnia pulex TaxID=6669 RepID=E9GQI4_DAPPU|nr:hypothetical protein DAPPUDRAFT_246440 [Daphnia pulex]|eukprot:EFX78122.1 hypothetical protein DAPPUDRAFT_246440 [Daphnia pulex]